MKRTPDFVTCTSNLDEHLQLEDLTIINLPSRNLAEGLAEVLKAGIHSSHFTVVINELGESFVLRLPCSDKYDYRQFFKSFKQRVEFLVDEYFQKNPFSAYSETN